MANVHVVQQGECLSSIARKYGFQDWHVLYDDAANAELKKRRPNPNALLPGDRVAIPEPIVRTATRPTGNWHDFTFETEKPRFKVQLLGLDGKALPSQDYQITVDGEERQGTTDGQGLVDEPVKSATRSATLRTTVPAGDDTRELVWRFAIGNLDPASTTTGLQARLANLQYYTGEIDGNFGPVTRGAVVALQESADLPLTGVPDDATLKELETQHDKVT